MRAEETFAHIVKYHEGLLYELQAVSRYTAK